MRFVLIFLLITITRLCFAQNIDSVSKIIFSYSKGNAWGDTLLIGKGEVFELVPLSTNHFKISKYLKVSYYGKPKWHKDTLSVPVKSFSAIPKGQIAYLLNQLNTSKNNFNIDFIKPKLRSPTKKEIMEIAFSDTSTYWRILDRDYFEKSERREAVRKIEQFDKLDSFINLKKPRQYIVTVVTDAWDGSEIQIISGKNDTIKYTSFFYDLLGQPFSLIKLDPKTGSWTQFINLEINTTIEAILPRSSSLKREIEINSLTKEYIKWYLANCLK